MTSFSYSGAALSNLAGNTPGANVSNLVTLLNDLKTFLNAPNLDGTNIADIPESLLALAVQQKLGLNDGGQIGRGKSIIATSEVRTNTAYGTLTTPDQVAGVVLPTDGLLAIGYKTTWQESVNGAARAALFIGANQLKIGQNNLGAPAVQEAACDNNQAVDQILMTGPNGLIGAGAGAGPTAYTGDVTTGQILGNESYSPGGGGVCYVFAAAGTYTVSVQFKSSSGTVTAKDRKLWVWTIGF